MAGAAQIQTRFGSSMAGVRISPRAEDRAVVKRKSDLIGMLVGGMKPWACIHVATYVTRAFMPGGDLA
jgi:hypothetical protein